MKLVKKILLVIFVWAAGNCYSQSLFLVSNPIKTTKDIKEGAERLDEYFPIIKNKSIAIVGNHTSFVGKTHLIDTLLALGINIKKIFCPEHGFRGDADAGEEISNSVDEKTKLPLISLYGKNFKPKPDDLKNVNIVIFDIQDVGVRCYTYLSTLHYVMEACAENGLPLIVLDRPNPNGYFIDGPVLESKYKSFVGMHPVPLVYGMTIGEYAAMINGEGWLAGGKKCDLKVIPCENYHHGDLFQLPKNPSPNLPDMVSVYLYPSLCLFEGTEMSVGRGTGKPFQCIGHPGLQNGEYYFTPKSSQGSKAPPYMGVTCRGHDLTQFGDMFIKNNRQVYLYWLLASYESITDKKKFFNPFFEKLTGSSTLRKQIMDGKTEEEIRKTWLPGMEKFKVVRKKYLLYSDF